MELSSGSPNSQDYLKFTRGRRSSNSQLSISLTDTDTIDVNKINFEDDESWLCSSNANQDNLVDLDDFLYNRLESCSISSLAPSSIDLQKNVDTRTFTRPKKKFNRPSIEKYNDDMYGSSSETITIQSDSKSYVIMGRSETDIPKPMFDLSQPSSSYYFEKMVADSGEADSFQNMSPPSLVNSMCSSTFANLMESSFIKNDPILREVRDADYSESVLLQDSETPMFQSISESCSSINSDTPENFLKKVSFNGTYKKNSSKDGENTNFDATYDKFSEPEKEAETTLTPVSNDQNQTYINPNGTYRRTPKHNGTFRKSDLKKSQSLLHATFELVPQEHLMANKTQTLIQDCNDMADIKRDMSEPIEIHTDLNRLSYCLENDRMKLDATYNDVNRMSNMKSSALNGSVGSAESLDRLSSMSGSSRGSNKMLNMADVDAIVEMQERSLHQVMSTPKAAMVSKKLWENTYISPIVASETSDSDLSSTDDYKSVRSTQSSKTSLDNYTTTKQPPKSLGYIAEPVDTKIKANQKSSYTVAPPKPLPAVRPQSTKINSYFNLRNSNNTGSNTNLYRLAQAKPSSPPPPSTNLKTMGAKLRGSYTSLRPVSSNLPVAPPLGSDAYQNAVSKTGHHNVTRVVEVQSMPREKAHVMGDAVFMKPLPPKASGLPRPTGIPRPSSTASRIPAPRSSNVR